LIILGIVGGITICSIIAYLIAAILDPSLIVSLPTHTITPSPQPTLTITPRPSLLPVPTLIISTETIAPTATPAPSNCDPSYPTVCIPSPPPDLNCNDIPFRNFQVLPPDPHGFDLNQDGVGCQE
jgi:hypothetical protein